MKTTTTNGYLFVNLCNKVGHKRYQIVFEDTEEGKTYVYETDYSQFADGITDIENDYDSNTYSDEMVELTYDGDEPTDADFERYDAAREAMHKEAEKAMIEEVKYYGEVVSK